MSDVLVPVRLSGPKVKRFNIVVVPADYDDLDEFARHARDFTDRFLATPPFDELRCRINVFRIDTRYDLFPNFGDDGIERLLQVSRAETYEVVDPLLPERHVIVVLVKTTQFGGSGDAENLIAVAAVGGDWDFVRLAIHEVGHAAFNLADEYPHYSDEACAGDPVTNDRYAGEEPAQPNITGKTMRNNDKAEWWNLILPGTPIPTAEHAPPRPFEEPCRSCAYDVAPGHENAVGLFEGAGHFHCGLYRPQNTCLMKELEDPFCAVCRQRILATIDDSFAPDAEDCMAPLFDPPPPDILGLGLTCLAKQAVLSLVIVILFLFSALPSVRCRIRRLQFEIRNCARGNDDACVYVGDP